ncbi:SDR family oxidoreductase [Desulfuromonas sp. TF]|uniref:SDR family oxidoreductase n=1 Tax=Desulfuromonas sp. TF TaxID=1232410 RepID=UPI000402514B|nr:SDR family oxidoreductase [Desulfuromonas sp. TF]
MAKFLVTGGAGFIGSHIVDELLRRGETVRVLDNMATGKRENLEHCLERIDFIEGDIRDMEICRRACADVDFVLHQAALGSVPRSMEDPLTSHDVNVTGTLKMLIAARDEGVKRFVYAASSSTYGDHPALPKVEDRIGNPLSPYAVTKYADELYARVFGRCYGLETVGLRYFNVFGPRQDPFSQYAAVIPLFVSALLRGEAPTINGDGEQTRDFTYVGNAVEANLLACAAPAEAVGEVFNVACNERTSLNRLYRRLQDLLGSTIEPAYGPPRAGDVRDSLADIGKGERLLGYKGEIKFDKGLRRSIEWYRDNL